MTRRIVLVGLGLTAAVVAAAGCGRHYWSRPGATLDDFNRDSAACAQAASPTYGILVEDNYRACLRGKGWSRAQQQEPVPSGWYRGIE
jgi:hypothetical protein